jgi:hypothetical protein
VERQMERRSQKSWRVDVDRRKFTDLNYKGSERRSGLDRRSVKDRRIGVDMLV